MSRAEPQAFHEAIAAQRSASDPEVSAFVDANAGAGKTSVLTARVARLLLAGAPPSKILCITYTKAAAAEMADRLLKLLGEWALADDAKLAERLTQIEGVAAKARDRAALAQARSLFARALETPGGLKIQTIHSFCESVLRRFPLETGAAPGFAVIDEKEALGLMRLALRSVHARADADAGIAAPLQRLTAALQPDTLRDLFIGNMASRQKIGDALAAAGGFEPLRANIARRFGIANGETAAAIRGAALAGIPRTEIVRLQAAFRAGGKNCQSYADKQLAAYLGATDDTVRFDLLTTMLFTDAGEPRSPDRFPDAQVKKAHPWTIDYCSDLTARLSAAEERGRRADNGADTLAFLTLLEQASAAYARLKEARAGLDYDDLIEKTRALFAAADGAWVRYKLDRGVDHILLDEAQDTSPGQWQVIEGPLAEFFAGEGAREARRTFFAVGDKKQSIYSFQGADAELFAEKEADLGKTIAAVQPYRQVPLRLSFRSTAPVLDFVDALFAVPEVLDGVGTADEPLRHELRRVGEAGAVELWPLVPKADADNASAWDAPLDAIPEKNPKRILANAVARDLKRRIGADMLVSKGRPLRASDILILVQSRGALFHETIKTLARAGVPVAGADRIRLLEEPAVEDALSFARAVLLYSDDLSLAETLRSPFFRVDEASLYDLAQSRGPEARLRSALRARAAERPEWAEAEEALARAERIARNEGAFAFLSHLIEEGSPSGRERLYGRLSPSAEEPLNELLRQALDYERRAPRSLQGFVNWMEGNAQEIRRDPDQAGDAVRVMTVHGAKGLEANVVILLDAHRAPKTTFGPLFFEGARGSLSPLLSTAKREGPEAEAAKAVAKRRAYEEYRRLLYVAATRARDRLIVCGVQPGNVKDPHKKSPAEKTWHALAEDAFARLSPRNDRDAPFGGVIRVVDCAQEAAIERKEESAPAAEEAPPLWLKTPAAPETRVARVSPSRIAVESETHFSPRRSRDSLVRGKTLHRLIELLPQAEDARREAITDRLLAQHAPGIPTEERARWRAEALAVVRDPAFAAVFGARSRAEVAIAGTLRTANGDRFVSGQIDRLAFDGERLLIVDYKTNRPPPKRAEDAPQAYFAQLAAYRALLRDLYPVMRIEAALLWTYDARLMAVSGELLDDAFARFLDAA